MNSEIAITHEHYLGYGGGEYVAAQLGRAFDAPIYAGAVDYENVPNDVVVLSIVDTWLGEKLTKSVASLRDLWYMLNWPNQEQLADYDVIIQSGNNPGWYVPTDTQTIVKYVHSTPRGPYDLYHEHDQGLMSTIYNHIVRTLYQQAVEYPDLYLANSDLVARRLKRYWGIDSDEIQVVYPPVETGNFGPEVAPTEEYYFTWSRLYGHKQTDKIVHAFNQLGDDYPLIVGGVGPERATLESIAEDHIQFVGWMEEEEKRELASGARAVVFAARNEDFGLVPVEAMASGTPVIGIEDGFTQYQITDTVNGLLFNDQYDKRTPDAIAANVKHFERDGIAWGETELANWAHDNFSVSRFENQIYEAVEVASDRSRIDTELEVSKLVP